MWTKLLAMFGKKVANDAVKKATDTGNGGMDIKKFMSFVTAIPLLFQVFFFLAMGILAIVLVIGIISFVGEAIGNTFNFLDKTSNFLAFEGWKTSEEEFYDKLKTSSEEYKKTYDGIGELDVGILSATIHYGKYINPDIYLSADKFDFSLNEGNSMTGIFGEIAAEESTRAFYRDANFLLGDSMTFDLTNFHALIPALISFKTINVCTCDPPPLLDFDALGKGTSLVWQTVKPIFKLINPIKAGQVAFTKFVNFFKENPFDNIFALEIEFSDLFGLLVREPEEKVNCPVKTVQDKSCPIYDNNNKVKGYAAGYDDYKFRAFNDYEKYRLYLTKIFVPDNYINCANCALKNSSQEIKTSKTKSIVDEIFSQAEYYNRVVISMIDAGGPGKGTGAGCVEWGEGVEYTAPSCGVWVNSPRSESSYHPAWDLVVNCGDKAVYPIAAGKVVSVVKGLPANYANCNNGTEEWGNHVRQEIISPNGTKMIVTYAHFSSTNASIEVGMELKADTVLGYQGNTGCSQGNHVHLQFNVPNGPRSGVKATEYGFSQQQVLNIYSTRTPTGGNSSCSSSNSTDKKD